MPMQPRPMAETSRLLPPSFRVCILDLLSLLAATVRADTPQPTDPGTAGLDAEIAKPVSVHRAARPLDSTGSELDGPDARRTLSAHHVHGKETADHLHVRKRVA